mmetsp:Transcript_40185/g.114573  ORF Transcript_40185/g.114573 Transcript_40185/m.114573 type:complete len:200 (+) Transcript_40185:1834-2433(+)
MLIEMRWVAPHRFRRLLADGFESEVEALLALLGRVGDARLALVQLVVLSELCGCEDGHQHVSTSPQCDLAPVGIDRLQSCCGGDVDVAHGDTAYADQDRGQVEHLSHVLLLVNMPVLSLPHVCHRCVFLCDVGPHAHHVDILIAKKHDVPGKILESLSRDANHHTAADLKANFLEQSKTRQPLRKGLRGWVYLAVQFRV